jgi:hypothetical protein
VLAVGAEGFPTDTVAVFAFPARTEVIVLLLTVWPLAIVVTIVEEWIVNFCPLV